MDAGGPVTETGTSRPFSVNDFKWKGSGDVKCIFVARKVTDDVIIADLIKNHREIDNITGSDIGFLVMFPFENENDPSEPSWKATSIAEIIEQYNLKPAFMAKHHTSAETINAFCDAFDIKHEDLPAMVVLVSAFPEQPFLFFTHKETSSEDIVAWLRQVRSAADNVIPKEVRIVGSDVERIKGITYRIETARKELLSALEKLVKRLKLPQSCLPLFVPHVSRTVGVLTAIQSTLADIKIKYELEWTSETAQRAIKTVLQRARVLEKAVEQINSVNIQNVHDVVAGSQDRAQKLLDEVKAASHSQMRRKQLHISLRSGLSRTKDLPKKIKYVTSVVSAAERFLRLIGM
jgi:hypothetical protein